MLAGATRSFLHVPLVPVGSVASRLLVGVRLVAVDAHTARVESKGCDPPKGERQAPKWFRPISSFAGTPRSKADGTDVA